MSYRLRMFARFKRHDDGPADDGPADDGTLAPIPGVLASTNECVHWLPGVGFARLTLDVSDAVVASWTFDSIPLMLDHGSSVNDIVGRIRDLRADGDEIAADFHFDPVLGLEHHGAVDRGTITDASVGFDVHALELVEEGDDFPLYRATAWEPLEGSLVWRGADGAAGLRRDDMDPKKVRAYLEAQGLTTEIIEAVVVDLTGDGSPPAADADEIDHDAIGRAIVRHLVTRSTPAPTPAPPTAPADALSRAMALALDLGTDGAVVARAHAECDGDAEAFGRLVREALQGGQTVPEIATQVSGGEERRMRVLADAEAILLARATPLDTARATAASKVDRDWRDYPMFAIVERVARAMDPNLPTISNRKAFLRAQMKASFAQGGEFLRAEGFEGRFVRAGGELLPGDLPTLFGNVFWKVLLPSYEKERFPFEQISRVESFRDLRPKRLIEVDIAGRFRALASGENLHPLEIREREGTAQAKPYGHVLTIGYASILNDDLGVLVSVPMKMGEWAGAAEAIEFQTVVLAGPDGAGYSGDFDLAVADPTATFNADLETIRQRALAQSVVPAGAGENPLNTPGNHRALVPSVMMYGKGVMRPLFQYAETQGLNIQTRTDLRTQYERTLYGNSHEGLEVDDTDYYVWPGPEKSTCPIVTGRVNGEEMAMSAHATSPEEQDGVKYRISLTFAVGFTRDNATYRVRPS